MLSSCLLLYSCLSLLAAADSQPVQVESGLTTVQYGDMVVGAQEPEDAGPDARPAR